MGGRWLKSMLRTNWLIMRMMRNAYYGQMLVWARNWKSAQKAGRGSARKFFPKCIWNFQGPRNSAYVAGGVAAGPSQFIPTANMYPAVTTKFSKTQAQVGVSPSTLSPCFECGQLGHYRRYCPKLLNKAPGAASAWWCNIINIVLDTLLIIFLCLLSLLIGVVIKFNWCGLCFIMSRLHSYGLTVCCLFVSCWHGVLCVHACIPCLFSHRFTDFSCC